MRSPKILIVDDNLITLESMTEMLECEFRIRTAGRADEALRVARSFRPDIILLDVMLPHVDGYTVCRHFRQTPQTRNAKIIMVSAKAMPSERVAGYESGADAYLTKPFDETDLLGLIHSFADTRRSDFLETESPHPMSAD